MPRRRQFVKAVGSLTAIGVAGSAAANPGKGGAEELGISTAVSKLINKGNHEQAARLLDKHDVPYDHSRKVVGSDEGVSPEWNYTESGTTISMWLYNEYDDVWTAKGGVSFDEDDTEYSYGTPNNVADGCGIVFDSSEWSALNPSDEGVTYNDGYADYLHFEHEEYNPNYGPTAEVHHEISQPMDGQFANMETRLTRVDTGNDNIPVQFAYEHTYALTVTGDVDVSINFGVLDVDLPLGGSTAWRDETTGYPS